jgi:phosphoserine aminotransferase
MARVHNFCAGPAALPEEVLKQAQDEMLDYQGRGLSVMEMSHRSEEIVGIAEQAEQDLRELMGIPDSYKVLFLQGGASAQFAMVPLNLLRGKKTADYLNTGQWSKKAIREAKRFCDVNVVASSEDQHFSTIPDVNEWHLNKEAAYFHYVHNETIGGLEFDCIPDVDVPLVTDMSSTILSRPFDVSKFGLIYAGAQKNIGPAGITVAIIREDLLGQPHVSTPSMFDYQVYADYGSMYNTPPTYAWYLAGLVFKWLKAKGGVSAMAEVNERKAKKLYEIIDASDFYTTPVEIKYRSWMNVPFTLIDASLDQLFLQEADANGFLNLKGHRSVGGMRASIYNAVPESSVDALIGFLKDFERRNG